MSYPNGQLLTNTYFGNTGDERLQEIWNQGSGGSTISKFDYTYDAEGEIQSWTQQTNSSPSSVYNFQYDAASQLVEALQSGAASSTNEYAYDAAGNRLSERTNTVLEGATYNNVNELVGRAGNGPLRFRGSVNEPISNATVAGTQAIVDSGTNFTGYATVSSGVNTVQVQVADFNGNTVAHYYSVALSNGTAQTLTYDLNGNLISLTNTTTGASMSNVWDAANRLVAIYSNGTYRSVFTYDGMGRRVRQTEISGTTTNSDEWMLWCGTALCEQRGPTGGTVSNRFFAQGEQIGGTNYFFTRDHLGSIREMTDGTGAIHARYSYDPWGRRTTVYSNTPADFGFTGHYYHTPSGLDLTLYRAYSPDLGRWLSRDPIYDPAHLEIAKLFDSESIDWVFSALRQGVLQSDSPLGATSAGAVYAYILNDPINAFDLLGLRRCRERISTAERWLRGWHGLEMIGAGAGVIGAGVAIIGIGTGGGVSAGVGVIVGAPVIIGGGAAAVVGGIDLYDAIRGYEWWMYLTDVRARERK